LGALAQRRVTDTYSSEQPVRELGARSDAYTPGDTDLSWTRITPWRSMLAAALDQVTCEVESVEVEGEEFNPSCELLAMWLADRLDVPVRRSLSSGPGLTAVRMATSSGPIVLDRADGSLATLSIEGQPDRAVALKRRETAELIAEELRRLDPDDTYASALRFGVERLNASASAAATAPAASQSSGDAIARAMAAVEKAGAAVEQAEVAIEKAEVEKAEVEAEPATEAEPAKGAEAAKGEPGALEAVEEASGEKGAAPAPLKPIPSGLSGKAASQ
ncbi:glucose-6-phosphate dehydrogenase assembly protein OpcA, partial [Streptomyces sp. NPDC002920]